MNDTRFNEQELDLIDLFMRLLEQWKGILVVGIVFAILLSAVMSVRKSNVETAAEEAVTEDTATEDMYQQACTALSQYADYMLAKDAYDRSIFTKNDFSNCNIVTCIYQIHPDTEQVDTYALASIYSSITKDADFTDTMTKEANKYWDDVDENSLYEILGVSATQDTKIDTPSGGIITVTFRLPKDADLTKWQSCVTDAINAYHRKMGNLAGAHSIKPILSNSKAENNANLVKQQNEKYTALITAKAAYDKTFAALGKDDQATVEEIIKEGGNSYNIEDYIGSLNQKLQDIKDAKASEAKPAETVQPVEKPSSSGFSIKYFVLGLIVGAFLYACAYLAYFILIRLVRNEKDLSTVTNTRNFGGVYEYPYDGKLATFLHDKKVYAFRTRKGKNISRICDDIISKLEFEGCNDITLVSVGKPENRAQALNDEQIKYLEDHNITVRTFNMESDFDEIADSVYAKLDNVLIEMLGNKTKWKDLAGLYLKLKEYNIAIIGSQYLEV